MKFTLATGCLLGLSVQLAAQCDANFTCTATTVCTGNTVNFTNTSTGSSVYSWKINEIPFSSGTNASYIFNTAGTSYIELVVSDGGSCMDSLTIPITVNQTPSVNVNVTPLTVGTNDSVHVTFTTSNVLPGATYTWNFCDATSASYSSAFYFAWTNAGSYCACVQLENPNGCVDNDCQNGITVFFVDGIEEYAAETHALLIQSNASEIRLDWSQLSQKIDRLYLIDVSGKIHFVTGALYDTQVVVDRTDMQSGVYFVVIETESGRYVNRFYLN